METQYATPIGPLYHGTRESSARHILRTGFRRGRSRSYTGTGVCLSESITVSYEYGTYETGGCVLEAWLAPSARWADGIGSDEGQGEGDNPWDGFFLRTGSDAVRGWGGNVWVVWNPAVLLSVRRLSHREAIRRMCAAFDADGPNCGYNGVTSEYAALWWGCEAQDLNLTRFPEEERALRQRLQRFVGRSRSAQADTLLRPEAGV